MGNEEMKFVIVEDGDLKPLVTVNITAKVVDSMVQNGVFNLGRLRFSIKHHHLLTQIHLFFGNISMHPISGFPRTLILHEDTVPNLPMSYNRSDSSSIRYTHGSRRMKKFKGAWETLDLRATLSHSNLRQYATIRARPLGQDVMILEASKPPEPTTLQNSVVPDIRISTNVSRIGEIGEPGTPRHRRDIVRSAFEALLSPLRLRNANLSSTDTNHKIMSWIDGTAGQDSVAGDGVILDAVPSENTAYLQHYNVREADYEIYKQWTSLLQPDMSAKTGYWNPLSSKQPGNFAQSAPDGTVHEMIVESPIMEMPDTGLVELADTSISPPPAST